MSDSNDDLKRVEFSGIDLGLECRDFSVISYRCADMDSAVKIVTRLEQAKTTNPDFLELHDHYYVQYPGGCWRVK